ncbi:unnamed protein product, partial [Mesorhabditis belari]|uniref:Saposin B-type domain-containing protein n=1 Tax=Mesorhabditis belari TaxID=2138241 RepID=A0AAF3ENF5_9BILA
MKFLVALLALTAVVLAQRPTGPQPTSTPCQICSYVVSQAEHHLRRGRVDEGELQIILLEECETLERYYGRSAVQSCVQMIDDNIGTILTDVNANKPVSQICQDIKQC